MSRDGRSHWYRDNNRWYMLLLSAVITVSAIANYRDDPSDTILWSFIGILSVASFVLALFMAGNTGVLNGGIVLPLSFMERLAGRDGLIPFGSMRSCRHRPGSGILKIDVVTHDGDEHRIYLGQGPEANAAAAYVMARVDVEGEVKDTGGARVTGGASRKR
jgi:hypothetical protein